VVPSSRKSVHKKSRESNAPPASGNNWNLKKNAKHGFPGAADPPRRRIIRRTFPFTAGNINRSIPEDIAPARLGPLKSLCGPDAAEFPTTETRLAQRGDPYFSLKEEAFQLSPRPPGANPALNHAYS
jgi:hypothetical protein